MKDIMGAALLGELLAALSRSSALRTSLGGVPPEDADAVVRRMVSEVERVASEGLPPAAPAARQKPPLYQTQPPAVRSEEAPRKPFPVPDVPAAPVQRPAPEIKRAEPAPPARSITREAVPPPPRPVSVPQPPVTTPRPAPAAASLPPPSPPPEAVQTPPSAVPSKSITADAPAPSLMPRPEVPPVKAAPVVQSRKADIVPPAPPLTVPPAPVPAVAPPPAPEPPSPLRTPSARVRAAFDDETAFLLAASLIPLNDTPSPEPFGVGLDGVERGSEIFAFDHAGMRFFLSTLKSQEASVSRTGTILLGKQESIKYRNVHEHLVNALRPRALVLPAEAGTVVFGKHDLVRRVDFRRNALFEILLTLSTLSTWRVHAFVVDAHVQRMLPAEASPSRAGRQDAERGRVPSGVKKTDIKTLERLLNREKKLAEAILQRLAGAADSHTVESMVSLGSGSSEDWKPILKAAFEVPPGRFTRFAETVVECEEANAMFEPMLTVVGGPGSFSLSM